MVVDGDRRAFGRETDRGRGADVAGGSGDEGYFAFKTTGLVRHAGRLRHVQGRRSYQIVQPPSTRISSPVMNAASSEARKRTA